MRINQSERLAAESDEERVDRWRCACKREIRANSEEPSKQCSVQMKMKRFHEYFAGGCKIVKIFSLEVSHYTVLIP